MAHSTNDQPPDFGPELPVYPALEQTIRVAGAALIGTSPAAYPSYTQQFVPPLSLRDREACYLVEPNRINLNLGYYGARLVGSLFGLPLYMTTCCPVGSSSSASAMSHSSASLSVPYPSTLTATFSDKTDCFFLLPDSVGLTITDGPPFGGFGDYAWNLNNIVAGCGVWLANISGIGFNFFGTPVWVFRNAGPDDEIAVAEDGWTLNPFSAIFLMSDPDTGAKVTITVTSP